MTPVLEKSIVKKVKARPVARKAAAQKIAQKVAAPKMRAPEKLVTAEEFWEMQAQFQNQRAELINGKVINMAPAGGQHGVEAFAIGLLLGIYVKKKKLGVMCAAETGFILEDKTVRAPDAAFISQARLEENRGKMDGKIRTEKFWPFAPDLAVEVVSPGDRAGEVADKVRDWLKSGVRLVWVIYPRSQTIHVFTAPETMQILEADSILTGGEIVPGFSCKIGEIFE